MEQAAEFLLAYQKVGSDGFLHAVANAHETQWAVQDPTTDLAADQALFPAAVSAATLLEHRLLASSPSSRPPRARSSRTPAPTRATLQQLLNPQPTSASATASRRRRGQRRDRRLLPAVGDHPQQREHRPGTGLALEPDRRQRPPSTATTSPPWPTAPTTRPNGNIADWNYDASTPPASTWRARFSPTSGHHRALPGLHLRPVQLQRRPPGDEPYLEQSSIVATAMDEALATDYDGTLRIAPAWPSGWNAAGTVYIQGGSKVTCRSRAAP